MAQNDDTVRDTQRACGSDVIEIAGSQELGSHDIDQTHPREQQHQTQEPPEIGLDKARHYDQQVEYGQSRPDLDEALDAEIDEAAEIALYRTRRHADHRR